MKRPRRVLFPGIDRPDTRRKGLSEGECQYLQRSPHIETARVRKLLREWFSHLKNGTEDFLGRFQSVDLGNSESAFFELYLHELLIRLGYSVVPHPEVLGGNPDFLVRSEDGYEFYIEAIAPIGVARSLREADFRRKAVLDEIAKLESLDFFSIFTPGVNSLDRTWPKNSERN